MDPIVVLILTIIALTGGGAGSAAVMIRRRQRKQALREALLDKVDHHGWRLSIFDVFWDLGVSEYALALMDHQKLLLHQPEDFERAHSILDDLIEAHGTYSDFLEDNLAAIQEFYRDHRQTGHRRKIPTLTLRNRKLLPAGQSSAGQPSANQPSANQSSPSTDLVAKAREVSSELQVAGDADADADAVERDLGRVVQDSVDDRRIFRENLSPLAMTATPDEQMPGRGGVDVDEVTRLEPLQMLKNIIDGRLADEFKKFWKSRSLRAAKSRLDEQFARLYDFYADQATSRDDFYEMLYDTAKRWKQEAERIRELAGREPWRGEPFADCAEVLVEQAASVAGQLANRARYNVDATVERIHKFAREGDRAMAGYLLYLNHHAFFAGRAPEYGKYVEKIERQAYRVREELRKLKREGEL